MPIGQTQLEARGQGNQLIQPVQFSLLGHRPGSMDLRGKDGMSRPAQECSEGGGEFQCRRSAWTTQILQSFKLWQGGGL